MTKAEVVRALRAYASDARFVLDCGPVTERTKSHREMEVCDAAAAMLEAAPDVEALIARLKRDVCLDQYSMSDVITTVREWGKEAPLTGIYTSKPKEET